MLREWAPATGRGRENRPPFVAVERDGGVAGVRMPADDRFDLCFLRAFEVLDEADLPAMNLCDVSLRRRRLADVCRIIEDSEFDDVRPCG